VADIGEIAKRAGQFYFHLEKIKAELPGRDFEWYRYYSLGNFEHFDLLLTGAHRDFDALLAGGPVLDIGCADGDAAFFLESLGHEVHAVDFPATNINRMRGVRALKQALGSRIEVHEMDLDSQFTWPGRGYSVAMMLGVLYHLKNPFYVLDTLSKKVRYLFLSTRIARTSPRGLAFGAEPVAYLLDNNELNSDGTNFWIFSEPGLRRLIRRTHWEVLDFLTLGGDSPSDPHTVANDERAFCLLRSRSRLSNVKLLEGWHGEEEAGWRWTERRFSFETLCHGRLAVEVYVSPVVIQHLGSVTLSARCGGAEFGELAIVSDGAYSYYCDLPEDGAPRTVAFELNRAIQPGRVDGRELGLVVTEIRSCR